MPADARIATSLPSHPKTKKLIKRLGEGAAWTLVRLFLWVSDNKPDGDLSGMTDEDIELAVDWSGSEGTFVATLVEVGFLDGDQDERCLHDWHEHNPWAASATDRAAKAKWNAIKRHYGEAVADERCPEYAEMRASRNADSNATSINTAVHDSVSSSAPSPSPIPSPSPSRLDSPNGESLSRKVRDIAPSRNLIQQAEEVLACLNSKLGRAFRARAPNGKPTAQAKLIMDRLREGYTVDDCKRVLRQKAGDWFEDEKMRQYLRPTTLYRAQNFVTYLGECGEYAEVSNGRH